MEQSQKRYGEIDVAKGVGILLVIVGHCFPDASTLEGITVPALRLLHDVIYTFHMPTMFMLAGFLAQRILRLNSINARSKYIGDRFVRLIIPYCTIGLLYMPIKMVLSKFASQPYDIRNFWQIVVGENPDGGLWYLWALFVIQFILAIFLSKKNLKYTLIISAIMSLIITYFSFAFYRIDDAIYYSFFVLLGIAIGSVYEQYKEKQCIAVTIIILAIFSGSVFLTVSQEITVFRFMCGTCGSLLVLLISAYISNKRYAQIYRMLRYIGRYSMDIYVMHGIVMVAIRIALWSILKFNYYVCAIVMLFGGLLIPIYISKFVLRKSNVLIFLFLGERMNKKL